MAWPTGKRIESAVVPPTPEHCIFLKAALQHPSFAIFFKLKTMYKHTFLLTLSALLLASSLGARTPEGPTTTTLPLDSLAAVYDLNQVVVTGTRHPRPLRTSPVLTQVVGQEQLRRGDWGEVTQVLENQLPGIEFSHGAYGSNISMMGLPGNYVLFLRDGNRISGESNANIDYQRLGLLNTGRIEIVRGASSVLYGSNAMAGVVHLLSRPISQSPLLEAYTRYSNFGTTQTEAALTLKEGSVGSRTTLRHFHTEGYDLNNRRSDGRTMERTTTHQLGQEVHWQAAPNLELSAQGHLYKNHVDASLPMRNNKMNDAVDYSLTARYLLPNKSTLEAVWHSDHYRIFEKDAQRHDLQYSLRFNNGRLAGEVRLGEHSGMSVGLEYLSEALLAPRNKIAATLEQSDWVGYVQENWQWGEHLTLSGGLRLNYNSDYGYHGTWQTAARVSWGDFSFRGNVGTGYKSPTLKDRHMEYQAPTSFPIYVFGNPDLIPETSLFTGLSAEYNRRDLSVSLHLYRNAVKDMITEVMETYDAATDPAMIYYYQNIEEADIRGMDLLLRWRPLSRLEVNASYALVKAHDQKRDRQFTGSRPHSGVLALHYQRNDWPLHPALHLQGSYKGKMSRGIYDAESGAESVSYLDDFTLWRANLRLQLPGQLQVQTGIDNLFDYSDPETFATFSPGRTFFISARLTL